MVSREQALLSAVEMQRNEALNRLAQAQAEIVLLRAQLEEAEAPKETKKRGRSSK